jgi:hypothetical protein
MARTAMFASTSLELATLCLRALRFEPREDERRSFDRLERFGKARQKFPDTANYAMWIAARGRGPGDPGQADERAYEPRGSRPCQQAQLRTPGRHNAEGPTAAPESTMVDPRRKV